MSLNKRICFGIDSEKRQSFSERICDDLCPHILQYLSLEDKLRLECVSQQFQRSIITSQRVISLDFKRNIKNWLIILESLLKKFPNTTEVQSPDSYCNKTIEMFGHYVIEIINPFTNDNKSDYNKAIELIIKYCNKLTHFDFCLNYLSGENLQNILLKYSLNFDSVNFHYLPDFPERYQQFFSSIKESNIKNLVNFSSIS